MDIVEEIPEGYYIEAVDTLSMTINQTRYTETLLITPSTLATQPGISNLSALTPDFLDTLVDLDIEVMLIGTGATQTLPSPSLYAFFAQHRIGLEIMDTPAACRTYNVLSAEARRVAALLMVSSLLNP